MTNEQTTLPGTIPGLIRRCSPVLLWDGDDEVAAVVTGYYGADKVTISGHDFGIPLSELRLDMSDPTGRAHAVWWLHERWNLFTKFVLPQIVTDDLRDALNATLTCGSGGGATSTRDIDIVRKLVLLTNEVTP